MALNLEWPQVARSYGWLKTSSRSPSARFASGVVHRARPRRRQPERVRPAASKAGEDHSEVRRVDAGLLPKSPQLLQCRDLLIQVGRGPVGILKVRADRRATAPDDVCIAIMSRIIGHRDNWNWASALPGEGLPRSPWTGASGTGIQPTLGPQSAYVSRCRLSSPAQYVCIRNISLSLAMVNAVAEAAAIFLTRVSRVI